MSLRRAAEEFSNQIISRRVAGRFAVEAKKSKGPTAEDEGYVDTRKQMEEERAREKKMRGLADTLDFTLKDTNLNPATWRGVNQLKKDLHNGKAKAKDLSEVADDLDFEVSRLQSKKDTKSKKQVKTLTDTAGLLRKHSKDWVD